VVSTIVLISSFVRIYSGRYAPTPVIAALKVAIDSEIELLSVICYFF
jgi:hypothetical protein